MVNQMCVITPGPVELKTSCVAPAAMGQRSAIAAGAVEARLLQRFVILRERVVWQADGHRWRTRRRLPKCGSGDAESGGAA